MKKLLTMALLTVFLFGSVVGCAKPRTPDTVDTLEIYIQDLGYGVEWLNNEIELFKNQDWVKEKYPNLNVPDPKTNTQYGYGKSMIESGSAVNTIDLFFMSSSYDLQNKKDARGNYYLETLEDVFEENVPGEDVLYKDKMYDAHAMMCEYNDIYWSTMWAGKYEGFLYNADILEKELGLEVPRTTDEFIKLCQTVKDYQGKKNGYDKTYSIMLSTQRSEANYWQFMAFPIWWAQYEGLSNYYNFYKGIHDDVENSKGVLTQQGRLKSLEVIEKLIGDYAFVGGGSIDFIEAQTRFLMGDGLFMINGDWFYNEMSVLVNGLKEQGYDYDIRFMKNPVISSIVEKTPSVQELARSEGKTNDQVLSEIVEAIDAGQESYKTVTEQDFKRIKEARSFIYTEYLEQAFIPSYATAKEVAKDFLRFLATDIALNSFMRSTGGATMPFKYDVMDKDPALYAEFDDIQKYRNEIYVVDKSKDPNFILGDIYEEHILTFGGLRPVATGAVDSMFLAHEKTAEEFYRMQIEYYTDARWEDVLRAAGVL